MARLTQAELNRRLVMATAGMTHDAIGKELARFARASLAEVIDRGEGSPIYDKFVNGREGAQEESVVPPGPIVYLFNWWRDIVEFGLETLRNRSPVKSGRYKDSWFCMVNEQHTTDFDVIPAQAKVILTNNQPYSRKIEVGFMEMSVPPGVVEDARKVVMRRFGNLIKVRASMIHLPNGYVLKGVFQRGIRPNSRKKLRRDTQAGALMTYPSLELTMGE
jgi:hypothetical protein